MAGRGTGNRRGHLRSGADTNPLAGGEGDAAASLHIGHDAAASPGFLPAEPRRTSDRSGTYHYSGDFAVSDNSNAPGGMAFRTSSQTVSPGTAALVTPRKLHFDEEDVRLDVDRSFPQMAISGTRWATFAPLCHWAASLTKTGPFSYEGPVFFFDPPDMQLFNYVFVLADFMSGGPAHWTLSVSFSADMGASTAYDRSYSYRSPHFHSVEFEYDYVSNVAPVTSFDTASHPTRPSDLPDEIIDIGKVFGRAGFDVALSGGDSSVPLADAGTDALWTNQELHDAMQIYWSRYAAKPQWSLWVLFAGLHHDGANQGGMMFDDIGPQQRQGTAIFLNSTTNNPPSGDPNPGEWRDRMRFWTAIHEMGHAFNLAHSFQKTGGIHTGPAWINMFDEPQARSFMNYPPNISGGEASYFGSFYYRFSDQELMFLRHAPGRFVEMGNEVFFTNHGYQAAARRFPSDFEMRLAPAAPAGRFRYLAPPVVEIEIVYRGARPVIVPATDLASDPGLTLIVAPEGRPARQWFPCVRHCREDEPRVLRSGDSIHDSIMIGIGRGGWGMTEPGRYWVQAVLALGGQAVFSNQLLVTVEAPASRAEERLSVDLFTPEVGQVLALNGSRSLQGVNNILAKALELRDNPISKLAAMALATPLSYDFKQFEIADPGSSGLDSGDSPRKPARRFQSCRADPQSARKLLAAALHDGSGDDLVQAMGQVRFLREAPHLAGGDGRSPIPLGAALRARLEAKRATMAK